MEQKRHVWDGDPAFPGMETFAPLMLTEGRRRGIPVERISQVSATNAAKIFGLYPKKGTLQPGSDGDVAVVNLNARDRIQASRLHSMSGFTPYEGMETTAVIEATWLRGHQVYTREKDWCGQPSGQVLLRPAGNGSNAVSQP